MSHCHTLGEGGQICHSVTLLKVKQVHGQGDKYVTVSHSKHKGKFSKEGGDKYVTLSHFRGGGQICHTVTLLKGSKYMVRGDKYVTVSHSKHKGKFSKEGGTNMSHCHTLKRKQVHGQGGQICHSVTLQTQR